MEVEHGHERKFIVCFYEFFGTFLFVYLIFIAGGSQSAYKDLVGALGCFALVSIFGSVSGGHFNPAVTLAFYIRERQFAKNLLFMVYIMIS